MIKVLHIVGDSNFGGAALGILRLASFWESLGWRAEVLATDPVFTRAACQMGIKVVRCEVVWRRIRPWRDLIGMFRLIGLLRRGGYTVVHTHTSKAGFIGRIAAWLAGVPVVVHTAHGFAFHEASSRAKVLFYTALERLASLCCHKVITVSEFHAAWGRRLGIAAAGKIIAIPNGIEPPPAGAGEHAAKIRSQLGVEQDALLIVAPSRLAAQKGLEDLIESAQSLRERMRRRFLIAIAGEGKLRPKLESMIRANSLEQCVRLLGFQEKIFPLLAAADIVTFPTWREGLSIALLEAMSVGAAIVATSIGSNREATANGEAALLVSPRDSDALAAAILRLANDPAERRRLGARAQEIFQERYGVERMLRGYHQVYLELIKETERAERVPSLLSS